MGDANAPCLIYLFPSLVLDTQWKFGLACFVTLALALAADFGCKVRDGINQRLSARGKRNDFGGVFLQILGTAVFTSQAFLSYALSGINAEYMGPSPCPPPPPPPPRHKQSNFP